ncbi:peroxidase family protein [Methylobacterium persicinum]|uniref:peroxidase family protein n=1 Tax=Methylobacterium persicinum TaxID=374426 RepID=UPI001EE161EA|nr:peroxidase family protein [Methylobacterium persicinum]
MTTQSFVNGTASGTPIQVGKTVTTEVKSLSGGELDPKYHPQFTASMDPTSPNFDPAHYIPNLADRTNLANDTNYAVTFTTDPTTKAVTTHEQSVIDYTPRMITQTVTQGGTPVEYLKVADPTAITHDPLDATSSGGFAYTYEAGTGVVLLRDGLNHNVYWNSKEYAPDLVKLVEADITAGHHSVDYYRTLAAGTVVGQDAHGHNVLWNADAYSYSKPIYDNHIDTSALIEGTAIVDTSVALLPGQADGTGGVTSQGDANLYSGAGYGTLSMTGQHDKQNTDANSATGFGNHEYFYGNIASIAGNAPNNGWFVLFGQFFDHGLDFIGKSSSYQIVIPLAVDDPLYGVIGPDGQPTTSITINRAIVEGPVQEVDPKTGQGMVDAQGNPVYVPGYQNHDSPYIDQSQTYGSQLDTDNILRKWVKDPNSGAWHPGDTLVDGHTVAPYENAFGNITTATLPTLDELRKEIQSNGGSAVGGPRADLSWEDVIQGLRERNPDGSIKLVNGQPVQLSEPLLLDNNPHFDRAHISQGALDAINAALHAQGLDPYALSFDSTGALRSVTGVGVGALAPFLNFSDFTIQANLFGDPGQAAIGDPSTALHAAIGELMMESVGDHYIAGDGRANENMGLTAVHHVFHEEHEYQVQNIETYMLGIDAENLTGSDAGHPHATVHDWQVAVDAKAAVTNAFVGLQADATASSGQIYVVKTAADHANPTTVLARDANGNLYATSGANPGGNGAVAFANFATTQDGRMIAADEGLVARDENGDFYVTSATHPLDGANGKFAGFVLNEFGNPITADGSYTDANGYLSWDQDKMFNAAKLTVEMEYQHMAVDQYARAVSPNIQEFAGYASDKNADISLEFGQAAFRFGHSTLRETIDTMDPTGGITGKIMSYALEQAFLDPALFAKIGPGAIALGMERQLMNEVDNSITPSLNEGLLGQPLDLGAINIARGRDVGMPTLNEAKTALGLKAYADWADFGLQMVHPEQLVNFVAAYSFDGDMTKAQTILDLYHGVKFTDLSADEQAYASTLGTTYAAQSAYASQFMNGGDKGIDKVDLWIGGLAETHVAGGVLGETFDTIFVTQIENLMDGDRFYYLQRLVNQQFGNEIQNEQFKDLVERNTGVTNLNGNIFAYADQYYDEGRAAKVATADLTDPTKLGDLYQGNKEDGSWHQVFAVDASGHSGQWLDASGNATGTIPTGAIYDLWGQEVTDLYAADGHKVFDRATMTWTDHGFDPTTGAVAADKVLYVDQATDVSTGISPGASSANFLLTELGADQHKYGQEVDAHAGDANTFGSGVAKDGVNEAGVTIIDESHNVGIGIWSTGGASTQANGTISEHVFTLPLNDGLTAPDGSVPPLLTALNAIGAIDPSVLASDHITVDENYILDIRPDGTTVNKDGSLDVGADSAEVLVGTQYNDYIEMGIGDDTAYGGAGNDIIFGGKSNAGHNTLYGGDGNDILVGGDAPDLIDGGKGDDWIWGASSGSSVNGLDQLIGGDGNDHIFGGIGIDKIFGGAGDDFIYGGQDTDPTVFGGDGNDYMNGGSGVDVMNGDGGDDIMDGGPGVDQLFGGSGDDILRPGPGVTSVGGNGGGADVLIGGDSATGPNGQSTDDGFDLADYSQQTINVGIVGDLANQALVSQLPQDKTPLPANVPTATATGDVWFEMEGVIGSKNADVLRGDSPGDSGAQVSHGDNWLIGGSGDDVLQGRGGNDVIVGGSVRLDTLIGTYVDPNGQADPYTSYVDGASHRVSADAVLKGGLLAAASTGGITFAAHFTDLLKSGAYKDYVLGDGAPNGGNDTALYTGSLAKYTLVAIDANGQTIANPHANWGSVAAFKITDTRTAADFVDANGNPLLDATGTPMVNEGTDLLIGIQNLAFADQTINIQAYFDKAPTLDLNYVPGSVTVASDNFTATGLFSNPYARGTGWAGNWIETGDTASFNPSGTGQIQVDNTGAGANNPDLHFVGATNPHADTISRAADLSTVTSASLSFSVRETGLTAGDSVKVYLIGSGAAPTASDTPLYTITSATGTTAQTITATIDPSMLTASAKLYFVSTALGSGRNVYVDNIAINSIADTAAGNNYATTYVERASGVAIAGSPLITDPDDTNVASAKIVLRDGLAGDQLNLGALTGGITASKVSATEIDLAGSASKAAYQAAIAAITFSNPTNHNPSAADRHIDVTVNDGLKDSNLATTTVHFTPVNDAPVAGADTIVTNLGLNRSFAVADWVLLANDTDADSTVLTITNVAASNPATATVTHANTTLSSTVTDTGVLGGSFTYTVNDSSKTATATATGAVTLSNTTSTTFTGTGTNNDFVLAADTAAHTINGSATGTNTVDYSAYTTALSVDFSQTSVHVTKTGTTNFDTLTNVQNFIGGSGNDTVVAATDTATHRYDGGAGTDTIDFSHLTGPVTVDLRNTGTTSQGGTATITIQNFEKVVGGAGADTVTVGTAATTFTGNGGADTLFFTSLNATTNANRTTFTDFTAGTDKISLAAIDANTQAPNTQHFTFNDATALWNGPTVTSSNEFAAGSAGQARYHYETVNGVLHTVLDLHTTNASGAADHQVDLGVGQKVIHASDLVLA